MPARSPEMRSCTDRWHSAAVGVGGVAGGRGPMPASRCRQHVTAGAGPEIPRAARGSSAHRSNKSWWPPPKPMRPTNITCVSFRPLAPVAWLTAPPAVEKRHCDSMLFRLTLRQRLRMRLMSEPKWCPSCEHHVAVYGDYALAQSSPRPPLAGGLCVGTRRSESARAFWARPTRAATGGVVFGFTSVFSRLTLGISRRLSGRIMHPSNVLGVVAC